MGDASASGAGRRRSPIRGASASLARGSHLFGPGFPHAIAFDASDVPGGSKNLAVLFDLQFARPSLLAVRLPVLTIGTLTVWLFNWLLERSSGRTVAWVGGLLLATDTMFLLTTCYDW